MENITKITISSTVIIIPGRRVIPRENIMLKRNISLALFFPIIKNTPERIYKRLPNIYSPENIKFPYKFIFGTSSIFNGKRRTVIPAKSFKTAAITIINPIPLIKNGFFIFSS